MTDNPSSAGSVFTGIPFALNVFCKQDTFDEVSMLLTNTGLSPRSIADLALVVSRSGDGADDAAIPTPGSVRTFWQCGRSLQKHWLNAIEETDLNAAAQLVRLEQLAQRLFTTEMLVRTWSTFLAKLDRMRDTQDLTRVCRNVVNGFIQVRLSLLSKLLKLPLEQQECLRPLDRILRLSDRWTDLLVGMVAAEHDPYEFAFNAERARDYHEPAMGEDCGQWANPIEDFVSAGIRLKFAQLLSAETIEEPELALLMRSIIASLPQASLRNQSLRLMVEWKIAKWNCQSEQEHSP